MAEIGNLPLENPRGAAAEVEARAFPKFGLLPFNRFDADRSRHWWLCPPGVASPAFPNGKAIFAALVVRHGYPSPARGAESATRST